MNTSRDFYKKFINRTINPADDFFKFVTDGWIKEYPRPNDYSSWNVFGVLSEDTLLKIRDIIDNLDDNDLMQSKMKKFYSIYTNYDKRNKEGVEPLLKYIDMLCEIDDKDKMLLFLIDYMLSDFGISVSIGPDEKDSANNVVYVYQNLTLDNKEYYLSKDSYIKKIRNKYKSVSKKILKKFGFPSDKCSVIIDNFLNVETEFASYAYSYEELDIPEINYNKYKIDDLSEYVGYDMRKYLSYYHMNETEELVVAQPEYVKHFFEFINTVSIDVLRDCVLWCIIGDYCSKLSEDFGEIEFEYTKFVSGVKERSPKWKRETYKMDGEFGEAIGKVFAEKYFSEEAKNKVIELSKNIKNSFKEIIQEQTWMSDKTKAIAIDKLDSMTYKVGYPDKWKDYSDFPVDENMSYLENTLNLSRYWRDKNIEECYNKLVDYSEWLMLPQDVNACYNQLHNEFCFPCGILQSPFYDKDADDAVNYGAIGVILGHEITHGFDSSGRKYDKHGNMTDWWTEEDAEKFNKLTENTVDRFNDLFVIKEDNVKANGKLTLNENIADNGGLNIAYNALKHIYENKPDENDEFNWKQRFFMSYALVWSCSYTEEALRDYTLNGVHSVNFNRVNGTLPMINEWYDAFNVKESDSLYVKPDKRGKLWSL